MALSDTVRRALWFSSGGYCQNPECRDELVRFFETGEITHLDELAHVIAASDEGPRGRSAASMNERDTFENIAVLCPTCHRLVDKNPRLFPVELLLRWKAEHAALLAKTFIPVVETRAELRGKVDALLARNGAIYEAYGPFSESAAKPITDAADMWKKQVISDVIPNNRVISRLFAAHRHLLKSDEAAVAERFRVHAEAFEYNHLSGDKFTDAPLFPKEITQVLR
jgi:hypothetical protein